MLRIGLLSLALLGGYEGLLRTGAVPPAKGLSQWQENVVRAEKFCFGNEDPAKVVFVGSSISENILFSFKNRVVPLAFAGESARTGMALVLASHRNVKRVVVEVTGTVRIAPDEKLTAMVDAPFTHFAVSHVYCLRQEYQPISVLNSALRRLRTHGQDPDFVENRPGLQPEAVRQLSLATAIKENATPFPPEAKAELQNGLLALKVQLDQAKAQGIECQLVWMPQDEAVNNSPRQHEFLALAHQILPEDQYNWAKVTITGQCRTNDGVHLFRDDCVSFARDLGKAVGVQAD